MISISLSFSALVLASWLPGVRSMYAPLLLVPSLLYISGSGSIEEQGNIFF